MARSDTSHDGADESGAKHQLRFHHARLGASCFGAHFSHSFYPCFSLGISFFWLQILVFFEVSCHPEQSPYRAASMLQTLDGLIRWLGFLQIDQDDPKLTRFGDHEVPTVITR